MKIKDIIFVFIGLIIISGAFYFIYTTPKMEIKDHKNAYKVDLKVSSKVDEKVKITFKEVYLLGTNYETDNKSYVIVKLEAGKPVTLQFYKNDITKKYTSEDHIFSIRRR